MHDIGPPSNDIGPLSHDARSAHEPVLVSVRLRGDELALLDALAARLSERGLRVSRPAAIRYLLVRELAPRDEAAG